MASKALKSSASCIALRYFCGSMGTLAAVNLLSSSSQLTRLWNGCCRFQDQWILIHALIEGRTCLLVTRVQFHIPVDSVGLFSRFLKTGVKLLHFLLHPHLMASSNPENDLKSQQGHIEPHASWVMRIISFCDTTFRTIFLAATVLMHITLHELKAWNFCFLETLKIKIAVTMSQWFLSSLKMQKW